MLSDVDSYNFASERELVWLCHALFPDQRMGHPRYYHDLGHRKLIYKAYGYIGDDPRTVIEALKERLRTLRDTYPNSALYWRRLPECSCEPDIMTRKNRYKATVRVAIDHPDWDDHGDEGNEDYLRQL
jgi:hypothetical protein